MDELDDNGGKFLPAQPESLLATLLNQPWQGVALFSNSWELTYANAAWRAITGSKGDRPVHLFTLLPQLEADLTPLIAQLANGQDTPPVTVALTGDDRPGHWEITLIPHRSDGATVGHVMLLEDQTDEVHAHAALERRVARHRRNLTTLFEVITTTADEPDLRGTLQWSLERILSAVQCPAGAIQLIDDFDESVVPQSLRLVAHRGLDAPLLSTMENAAIDGGLAHLVMQNQDPLTINALAQNPTVPVPLRGSVLQTYVGAAMRVRERTVGVLSVFAAEEQHFDGMELALLDSVADQIAVVVENAFLHKRAEEAAVIEERHRLARELHDSVTQAIYSLTLFTEAGLRLMRSGDQQLVLECLTRLDDTSRQALREMRLMLHKLRPPDLEAEGLSGALQQRLNEVETRTNVTAQLIVDGDVDDLPGAVEEQLYRIAQEALNNALKHSNASLLTIRITADDEDVALEISDNGCGFDVDDALIGGGLGLRGLEERVEDLDGELLITSAPGEGTTIAVNVDLNELDLDEQEELF